MSYTITAAQYADERNESVVVQTVESGAVAISLRDRPALWLLLMESGVKVAAYAEPIKTDDEKLAAVYARESPAHLTEALTEVVAALAVGVKPDATALKVLTDARDRLKASRQTTVVVAEADLLVRSIER